MPPWRSTSPTMATSWRMAASSSKDRPRTCGRTPTSRNSISASTRSARANPTATSSTTAGASAGCPRRYGLLDCFDSFAMTPLRLSLRGARRRSNLDGHEHPPSPYRRDRHRRHDLVDRVVEPRRARLSRFRAEAHLRGIARPLPGDPARRRSRAGDLSPGRQHRDRAPGVDRAAGADSPDRPRRPGSRRVRHPARHRDARGNRVFPEPDPRRGAAGRAGRSAASGECARFGRRHEPRQCFARRRLTRGARQRRARGAQRRNPHRARCRQDLDLPVADLPLARFRRARPCRRRRCAFLPRGGAPSHARHAIRRVGSHSTAAGRHRLFLCRRRWCACRRSGRRGRPRDRIRGVCAGEPDPGAARGVRTRGEVRGRRRAVQRRCHRPRRTTPPPARERHCRRRGSEPAKSPHPADAGIVDDQRHHLDPRGLFDVLRSGLPRWVVFFLSLVIDGALAGALYALIALAFVLVYKATHMVNFAIGEWVMWGALLVATGVHAIGLGPVGAVVFAGAGMIALAFAFSRLVLRRMTAPPVITLIMLTLGLGAVMRGVGAVIFARVPGAISLPVPVNAITIGSVPIAPDKLIAASVAAFCVALVGAFYRHSRTGLALQAIADDRQTAMSVGIDVDHHFLIVWALAGVISVAAGVLWTFVAGGGFGVALVGLKVFPIVIIGGLDSIPGAIVGAMIIGVLESLGAGYLDPHLGGGFGNIASYLLLIAMLVGRPAGLFGRPRIERV